MHPAREKMNRALKAIVVPKLRTADFTGSFPHFRRVHPARAELVVFQFNKYGGSFVVEIASLTDEEAKSHWRADLSLKNATVYEATKRHRLGAPTGGDKWFVFGKTNDEPGNELIEPDSHYASVSEMAAALLASEAEQWWRSSNPSFNETPGGAR